MNVGLIINVNQIKIVKMENVSKINIVKNVGILIAVAMKDVLMENVFNVIQITIIMTNVPYVEQINFVHIMENVLICVL